MRHALDPLSKPPLTARELHVAAIYDACCSPTSVQHMLHFEFGWPQPKDTYTLRSLPHGSTHSVKCIFFSLAKVSLCHADRKQPKILFSVLLNLPFFSLWVEWTLLIFQMKLTEPASKLFSEKAGWIQFWPSLRDAGLIPGVGPFWVPQIDNGPP